MLSQLDDDVLLCILDYLEVQDILSLRLVSNHFHRVSRLRSVWHKALELHVLSNDLPVVHTKHDSFPNDDISTMSSERLERLTRSSIRASRIWHMLQPIKMREMKYHTGINSRVFKLSFLRIQSSSRSRSAPDSEGRFLLSVGHASDHNLCLQLWDVESSTVTTNSGEGIREKLGLAGEWAESGRQIGTAVDEGDGLRAWAESNASSEDVPDGAVFAVSERLYETPGQDVSFALRVLHFMPSERDNKRISPLKSFLLKGPVNLQCIHGDLMAIQVRSDGEGHVFGHGTLKVIDWIRSSAIIAREDFGTTLITEANPESEGVEYGVELAPSQHGVHRSVLKVQFIHDWAIVFRESALEVFFIPPSLLQPSSASGGPRRINPSAVHKWPWQINSIAAAERVSWAHERASRFCSKCQGTGKILHSPHGDESQTEIVKCTCRYRPISIVVRFDSYFPWPVNLIHHYVLQAPIPSLQDPGECPYILPPKLLNTVPSTVRLFGHSELTVGRYGEVVWTDSEYARADDSGEAYFPLDGTGERLSGSKLVLPHPNEREDDLPDIASLSLGVIESESSAVTHHETETSPEPTAVQGRGSVSALQMSQFAIRRLDGWFSLALCERAGRIAVGDGNGQIDVFDYI